VGWGVAVGCGFAQSLVQPPACALEGANKIAAAVARIVVVVAVRCI
jgi:hypothetical protein